MFDNLEDRWDHPRGCGEHNPQDQECPLRRGSSPRMRGAPSRGPPVRNGNRIIPADAGSTCPIFACMALSRDHPRGCGERMVLTIPQLVIEGSSPRMRGAHFESNSTVDVMRIIPADAGSTARHKDTLHKTWDHPRGCGEHMFNSLDRDRYRGSSPRMRGAPTHG